MLPLPCPSVVTLFAPALFQPSELFHCADTGPAPLFLYYILFRVCVMGGRHHHHLLCTFTQPLGLRGLQIFGLIRQWEHKN